MDYIILTEIIIFITALLFVIKWGINLLRKQNDETKLLNEALDIAKTYLTDIEKGNAYMANECSKLENECNKRGLV